jgi:hypothetical protein
VLDGVERRRFLIEPAGEDTPELVVGPAHVELDEGAGQLLDLPCCGGFAGAQPDDGVANPDRLTRPQSEVPLLAIAFVEEADDGDPLRHWGRPRLHLVHGLRNVDCLLVLDLGVALAVAVIGAARGAGGEREHRRQASAEHGTAHRDQSGVQAW